MIQLDIWSDIVCPWCYIGKRRMERALEGFEEEVQITWRSFELDPHSLTDPNLSLTEMLAKKYGMSLERARQAQAQVTQAAKQEGLDFVFDEARPANTFDAHRLLQFAHTQGKGGELKERLMRAYFSEGKPVGDLDTLTALAAEVGLPEDRTREVLESDAFGAEVRGDEAKAMQLGVRGVPFFVINGTHGISGAQPTEVFKQVFETVLAERAPDQVEGGAQCDDDGVCEVP